MDSRDCDERELELEVCSMELEIDGLKIEIPENLVQERMELIGISREEVQEKLEKKLQVFQKCLISNNEYNENTFGDRFVRHIDSEMAIYRL